MALNVQLVVQIQNRALPIHFQTDFSVGCKLKAAATYNDDGKKMLRFFFSKYMSIKFIFMALTYNVWPSIAIVAIFFGSVKLKQRSEKV